MGVKAVDIDARRQLILPGDHEKTLQFCVDQWLSIGKEAIADHGFFAVALSGGSTPKLIFQRLAQMEGALDWSKVFIFWSDERSVPPTDPDSNYKMAMDAGLSKLPLVKENIFRMVAERDIEANAESYERKIKETLGERPFDLVMLGMGDDGHTASLFPHTHALEVTDRLVTPNFVKQKETWRMSFTYPLINAAHNISIYVLGAGKAEILNEVLTSPLQKENFPSQAVGTAEHKASWIADEEASKILTASLK